MPDLLARHAECVFWMARYMERIENLARILDVNETFARDSRGAAQWLPIIQLHTDEERFRAAYGEATAEAVLRFYLIDRANPTSIVYAARAAKENARTLRHLISTEMWRQINIFCHDIEALDESDIAVSELSTLATRLKEGVQTHTGVVEGTFYRDQAWDFYLAGRDLERADAITRLLDIKSHRLSPPEWVGQQVDIGEWNALLRSAAGYHAFRRIHPRGMSMREVAGFLLLDRAFPRSLAAAVEGLSGHLTRLVAEHGLPARAEIDQALAPLEERLAAASIDVILGEGMHEVLDWVQRQLIALGGALGRAYFGHPREVAA